MSKNVCAHLLPKTEPQISIVILASFKTGQKEVDIFSTRTIIEPTHKQKKLL